MHVVFDSLRGCVNLLKRSCSCPHANTTVRRPLHQFKLQHARSSRRNHLVVLLLRGRCGDHAVASILLAYFLDPAVEFLEKWRVPRTVGAMIMVLILIAVLFAAGYGLWTRTEDFASNWPRYSGVLRQAAVAVEGKIRGIEVRFLR